MLDRRQTFRIRPTSLDAACDQVEVEVDNLSLGGARLKVANSDGFEDSVLVIHLNDKQTLELPFTVVAREPGVVRVSFLSLDAHKDQLLASFIFKWQQDRVIPSTFVDDKIDDDEA